MVVVLKIFFTNGKSEFFDLTEYSFDFQDSQRILVVEKKGRRLERYWFPLENILKVEIGEHG